ncbi:TonB-dependent receptor [Edaphobacter bradus]|uniref:TonB-dependent receptor n=1 Tax=Edaphobacter bradus TaxID=2259016 RepID=UPI0021E0864B|nr:TonB-dependent receptor [Edaphobacter bradus]
MNFKTIGRIARTIQGVAATLVVPVFCVSLCVYVSAQTNTGRILGAVTDPSGATVPGATVTITDVQRGTARSLTTTLAGEYVAPDLIPGMYKVRVEAKGFKSSERADVQVAVASDSQIDFALETGQTSETVTVSGQVPLINTTSSSLGGTLTNKEINDLPLNGRNYENLLQLRPGVVRYPGGGFSTTSANGLRAEDNAYIVDGLFNSEPFSGQSIINGAGIAGDSATILPVDAIQEFTLIENPSAEYGWKPGAMVNVALKSGTNALHGTAYAFGRDTPLDARNYFNTVSSGEKNPRNLEQFGGTVGGPILRDRLFFFGGYEGQKYSVSSISQLSTPATVSLGGDPLNSVPDAIAGVQKAGFTPSPASVKIAGCKLGPPITCDGSGFPANDGKNSAGPTSINYGLPNDVSSNNAVAKIDFQVNQRHLVNGLYFFGNNNGTVSDANQLQQAWLTQIHTRAQVVGLSWTWILSPQMLNEARFGFNRLYQPTFPNDHDTPASAYGLNTGVTNPLYGGLPRINISDFYIFPQELGGFNWPKVQGPDDRFQFIDHVSYTVGKHAVKFGGELHRDSFTGGGYGGVRGRIKFGFGTDAFPGATSLEDFFAGVPASGSLLTGDPTRNIHNWGVAGFVQDDWRVTKNLTLNLGLRYELNTVVKEEHNLLGNFDPQRGLVQVGKGLDAPYNGDHTSFAPRLGFAWDITGNGRTVVRGGGGLIYETLNWESFLALNNSFGISTIPTGALGVGPGGSAGTGSIAVGTVNFPGSSLNWNAGYNSGPSTVFPTGTINCGANPCSILGMEQNLRTPEVFSWNLTVQHAFTPNLTLETAYVGSHGTKLVGIHDINQNVPALDTAGDEQSGRPFNAKFPFLSFIYQMGNIYKSNYNGLQMTFTGRDYHHLTFVAGYTFSHSLDDVGANWDFGAGSGLPQDGNHPEREYSHSDFDIRHRFTLSASYAIPGRKSFAQLLEGWQVNSIVSLYGAQPWGPIDAGNDLSHTGEGVDRWDFFGNPKDFKSGANPIPYLAGSDAVNDPVCAAHARSLESLASAGCYKLRGSVMTPPAPGTFGLMGRNTFRDSGFKNWDFSLDKNWKFRERFGAQFRGELFNILNHPNFANPFGGQNGWGHNDPSVPGNGGFGCGCATPDVAASNPIIGSGGSRAVQLGLKLSF